ncbi:MAG TPA: 5-formyltetrahydrofolate cyclo-ligase [Candidatus Binataceae bacterium]|nr:5-formyltetrahydrofolate cyclo-ligase [Candidatus Binataceae bacterium]
MADDKQSLRAIFARSREALDRSVAERLSSLIQRRVIEWEGYRRCGAILLYAAHRGEVAMDRLFADALGAGKSIYYPRLTASRDRIAIVPVRDLAALRPRSYGISEPVGEEIPNPGDLDHLLICVPGLAFSLAGTRLGRGGGHYDRLLATVAPPAITLGLAYSFQLLDELPSMPHDRRLDFIVTESALHPTGVDAPAPVRSRTEKGGNPRCT